MNKLDLKDIQGLIKRGFDDLPYSNILLLRVEDGQKVKAWLKSILPSISRGDVKDNPLELNIAFTYEGFKALGITGMLENPFSREFEEGMTEANRSRLLGDCSAADNDTTVHLWDWRDGAGDKAAHIILLVYGLEEDLVKKYCSDLRLCHSDNGLSEFKTLLTVKLDESREHFGFHDGISQPFVEEFASARSTPKRDTTGNNPVSLGEFVLGYPNQYGKITPGPTVKAPGSDQEWDFGKNGTYLVLRQLEQHVKEFWQYMVEQSRNADGTMNMEAAVALASSIVGRWPSGAPVICSPTHDDEALKDENDFVYGLHKTENFGKCPFGAHILRANPRDMLSDDLAESLEIASHHRLLRRGRSYGRPFITSMKPAEILSKAADEHEERGLHFIALNANISRQFEFVQSTWMSNNKFGGLYNDADQISGVNVSDFTIQQKPVSRCLKNIPAFVSVRGGGYFFMPSHSALRFLTEN